MWNFLQIMKLDYVTSRTHKRKISRVASSVQYANHILLLFNVHSNGGACYAATLGIRAFRPGKRNSKAPRHGSSAPRFGGALCSCDCALLARLIGRRRRCEPLASWLFWKPRGVSAATGMVAHVDLLSHQRVGR